MTTTLDDAGQAARAAHDSTPVELLARLGLASRGLVFLVLGILALALAFGSEARADHTGAFRALADKPFGEPLLLVLAIGFAGYAAYLLLSAVVGHRSEEHRAAMRLKDGGKSLVYAALSFTTLAFLARGGGGDSTQSRTADLMARSGGRAAVAAVGLVVLGIGIYLVAKGLRRKHAECLEQYKIPRTLRRPAIAVGAVGYVGRGVTVGLIGAFLVQAAVQTDPKEAKGLDAALHSVLEQPYGPVLLGLTAIGVLAYALWSFIEAGFRRI
ncbi:MAG: DUF1206 domain-containing protein [Frankiales bacterium]|nr:MAG: DUF1206 domain-containing protein [Frankiales bacterium]